MKTQTIEELAYLLKEAKGANKPAPIFFLGAGASKSGGIPLAGEIIEDILKKDCDNPAVKKLTKDEQTYAKLMECLSPHARNKLLKGYIDKAKINVPHIYLAQLMINGFADYILTVNFDNLMLRALALFNEFPPTYDMAILKDMTTTSFKPRSVVYLHGQHHGLWLLNTQEEMAKVNEIIPPILNKITSERPWIFIGYSGDDPIFDHIQKLGRFDNGLYWVSYKGNTPSDKVEKFLKTPNTNAYLIEGSYDADSFMLKLNSKLGLDEPDIISKPFNALQSSLNQIVDIDNEDHFKGVKKRLEIAKRNVSDAIQQYEKNETEADALSKQIIELIINDDEYPENEIKEIEHKAKRLKDSSVNENLASLLHNWGFDLDNLAQTKSGNKADELYQKACDKYAKAIDFKQDKHNTYNNWGGALSHLAQTKSSNVADKLYQQAFDKYAKAIEFKQDLHEAYYNWGNTLSQLAQTKSGSEADDLYQQALEKHKQASALGAGVYNLACLYALTSDRGNALKYLKEALNNKQITADFVKDDTDWKDYQEDKDFKKLLEQYKNS